MHGAAGGHWSSVVTPPRPAGRSPATVGATAAGRRGGPYRAHPTQACGNRYRRRQVAVKLSITLLFGQQTEPLNSLSWHKIFDVNRRKIEK